MPSNDSRLELLEYQMIDLDDRVDEIHDDIYRVDWFNPGIKARVSMLWYGAGGVLAAVGLIAGWILRGSID